MERPLSSPAALTGIGGRCWQKAFIEEERLLRLHLSAAGKKALDAAVARLGPQCPRGEGTRSPDEADLDRSLRGGRKSRAAEPSTSSSPMPGREPRLRLGKITAEHIDETFDTNVEEGTIFTVQKALAADGQGRFDHPDRIEQPAPRAAPGMTAYSASKAAVRNLARTPGAEDLEGHRHPGQRAVARGDGDRTREEGSARRGGPEGLHAAMTPLQPHGRSGGNRSGGVRLSRLVGQQLHDRQRGRRRRRPCAILTRCCPAGHPFDIRSPSGVVIADTLALEEESAPTIKNQRNAKRRKQMSNNYTCNWRGKLRGYHRRKQRDWPGHSKALRGRRCPRRDHWATRERAQGGCNLHQEKRWLLSLGDVVALPGRSGPGSMPS